MSINLEGGWLEQVRKGGEREGALAAGSLFLICGGRVSTERASVYAHLEVITQSTFGLHRGAGWRRRKTAGAIHETSPQTRRRTGHRRISKGENPLRSVRGRERRERTMWCFIRHADRISSPPLSSLPLRALTFEARVIFINNRTIVSFSWRSGGRDGIPLNEIGREDRFGSGRHTHNHARL